MIAFIIKNASKIKSGKKFYRESKFSVTTDVYYFLLPEHAKLLKSMINLPI